MDYPKSVPNVGLVDGQFADENPATGQVGSLIPSAWGNAVTQELLNVIKAAGFAPAEGQTNQLLKAIQGLVSQGIKNSVRVATTGAIALSGIQTIDAIVLVAGDRVLVKNQASGAQNGIYVVATGAWVRAPDADESVEVKPGMLVGVDAGTVNGGSVWRLSNATPPTLGTTALTFEQVFGKTGVVAGSYKSVTVGTDGRVTGGTNPTTLAGFGITDAFTKAESNAAMQAAIDALVGSAPDALNALNELAAALNNDPQFATNVLNLLAGKADKGNTLAAYGITDGVKSATSAGALAKFNAIVPSNFYFGAGSASAGATPGAPPGSSNGALGIIAITPRADFTYYLVFEYSTTKAVSNVWIGRYASTGELFWLSLLTGEFATQSDAETGTDETKPMNAKRVWQAITKRIASLTQVNDGANDTTMVTPKKLKTGVAYSFGSSGYIGLPSWLGGFMVQWGRVSGAAGSVVQAFPTSFSSNCYGVMGCPILGSLNRVESLNVSALAAMNFTCSRSYSAGGTAAGSATEHFYLAWGV
ncbi:hypothetical protein CS390_11180 [Pseudomonas sp. HLS-6]|uniref:gp53-like domain-containing protein n=1 Tax=Pseudomonas sp. HLS-6 TaxID=2049589 RepID=UPI000C1A7C9F|nr:hypothetical protein [Pseudomonas sp. HLS-6]ATR83072.1 hypothetical protein CS390_11180 [Pseudomonas sp. HLS-6]